MSQVCDQKKLDEILAKYDWDPGRIIAILQDTQEEYHYLPREAFEYYAEKLQMSRAKAVSYTHLHLADTEFSGISGYR